MTERYKIIPEVFLFLLQEDKILLSRRFQTGYEDGNYGLPAGHGEYGETMREGTAREALEEIGITINPANLEFAITQHRWCPDPENPHARVGFYFVAKKFSGTPHNAEPDRCDDLQFFSFDDLPQNMVPHVRAVVHAFRAGDKYTEFNWETRA
ncbi:MAG: NUDIX domain-containing protein [Patescibacteria group bacterium]